MYNSTLHTDSVKYFTGNTGKLKPTNRNNPCPVCDNIDGRCRITSTELILCMESEGDNRGYKDWGKTKDGMWTKYAPQKEWTPDSKPYNPRKVFVKEPDRAGLTEKELDQWNRKLLSLLTLHPEDLADCRKRGLTDDQIQRWGIKSVSKYQSLPESFPENLPGIAKGGRSLINKVDGYLTPIYNMDNYIVGFQVRDRNPVVLEDGRISAKYKWLSTTSNPVRVDSTGELPLTVFRNGQNIAMVEGLGAKPFLLSERLGVTAIGAAGGNFNPCSKTLIQTLEKLAGLAGLGQTNTITFYPDAGAVENRHVLGQYYNTFELLEKSGFKFNIAWWGQIVKGTNPDIDELHDLGLIKFISKAQFEAIARVHCPKFFEARDKAHKPKDRLTPEETKVAKKIISVVPGSNPVNPLEAEAHQSQFKQWKRFVTGYTSNHDICSKYLSLGLIKDQIDAFTWGIFIRSPLGSGKTWLLKPGDGTDGLIDHLGKLAGINPEEQARIGGGLLGYRNTLSIQIGKAIDAIQIGNANEQQKKLVDAWLAGCIDSLEKVPVGFFKGKLLILDELTSVIDHMIIGSTCHDKRDYVFERFTEAVKDAKFVVCLDANMADWAVDFITTLRNPSEEEKCLKVNNIATPKDTQVEVIATFSQKEITQKILELAPYYHAKDQAIAIASDSQAFLEKIDGLLAKQGFDFFRLDSKTTHKKECMDFIEDPESIETPMRLGFSPVCDTGLNVSSPKYVHTFGYFCGVLGTASQIQMLRRPRASTKITVSCVPYTRINAVQSSRKSEFVEEQKEALFKGLEGMPKELLDQVKAHWGQSEVGIQFKTLWDLKHYRNYERKNTLECLVEMLKTHGYSPTVVEAGAVTGQQKEELLEYRRQEAIALFEARQITDDEAQSIASKTTLWTTQERREYRSWEIKNAFPDWANNWNPEWIFDKDNELINSFDYKAQLKEVGTAIQIKEATGIYNAVDITARQAESLRTKIGLTPQEWCQLERYKIKQDLLTIENYNNGEFWNIDAIVEIRKRIYGLSAYKIKWCYENLEKAKAIRQLKWVNDLEESRFIGDCLQNYYGKAKLLQELNLSELPKEFSADTPLVKKLSGEIARSKRERLRGTLGAVKGQMENIPWIKRLLGVMGEKVVCTGRSHGESRTYTIAEFDALDKAIFACISKTLEIQYQTTLEPCHQSRKEEEKSNGVVLDQTDNPQKTQPPAPAPLEVVAGTVKMDKINKYDRFLYRGYEVVYLKSFAGDMDFYVVMLNKVISLCNTSELIRINGSVDSELRNFLESEVA